VTSTGDGKPGELLEGLFCLVVQVVGAAFLLQVIEKPFDQLDLFHANASPRPGLLLEAKSIVLEHERPHRSTQ
jgi:hypothetical protein